MTLNLDLPISESQLTPKITVIGVGGAGGNAVNNMIQANLEGVDFLVANTDAQALNLSLCKHTVQIGRHITQGLGAGSRPEVGRAAAEEAMDEILAALEGVNMVFIAAGMGGGTGTGAAPVIARATREAGILTVGVCTKPFQFEGIHRMQIAEAGLTDLQEYADTLIIIPNQNLFRVANEKTTFADAFKMADDVLHAGVRGVTDLIVMPGLINLDFADIRAVMSEMGKAMMGTGEADSDHRSIEAAEAAISNPLLDEVSMKGARGVLINITGGDDLTLFEVDEAANRIRDEVDPDANIIFGSTFEQSMNGRMRVSVVATGIDTEASAQPRPVSLSLVNNPVRSNLSGHSGQGAGIAASPSPTSAATSAATSVPTSAANPAGAVSGAELTGEAELEEPLEEAVQAIIEESGPMAPEEIAAKLAEEPLPETIEPEDDGGYQAEVPEEDSFIVPPAAEAPVVQRPAAAQASYADPFREAEVANSGQRHVPAPEPVAPRKAQGLLAKVTGAARAFHEATQGAGQPEPVQRAPRSEATGPAMTRQRAQPTQAAQAAQPAQTAQPAQPRQAAAAVPAAPATPAPRQRASNAQAGSPATASPRAATAEPRPATPTPDAAVNQPRLTGLDPAERVGTSQSEEDLLDIPAFLRRQAN